ncbi:MAG: hypothetical protein M1817_001409 [Caeruleum heppii]|nr:MAG: hypothetical protein M1817_001409 [Caeruleum heppii]
MAPGKGISAYDAAFEEGLVDSGIYPYNYGPNPSNWNEIIERLEQRRASLSPAQFSDETFQEFKMQNNDVASEAAVMSCVFPTIRGNVATPSGQNRVFNNFEPLRQGFSNVQPDYYNGSLPQELDARVRNELGSYIMPSTQRHSPLLPNFFMEAKGPKGFSDVLKRQATHAMAYGARAMLEIQSYGEDDRVYDGNAYTVAATYHFGEKSLSIYVMHPAPPAEPRGRPEFRTTLIDTWYMHNRIESFRQGASAFRNLQEWAKEKRQEAIARANAKADVIHPGLTIISDAEPGRVFATGENSAPVPKTPLGGSSDSHDQGTAQHGTSRTSGTSRVGDIVGCQSNRQDSAALVSADVGRMVAALEGTAQQA